MNSRGCETRANHSDPSISNGPTQQRSPWTLSVIQRLTFKLREKRVTSCPHSIRLIIIIISNNITSHIFHLAMEEPWENWHLHMVKPHHHSSLLQMDGFKRETLFLKLHFLFTSFLLDGMPSSLFVYFSSSLLFLFLSKFLPL